MKRDTPEYVIEIAKKLRKRQTEAENLLWKYLRGNRIKNVKFRRQYPIGRYIADFYCIKQRLAIELDGKIHDEIDRQEYDLIRQSGIESRNIKVLRFRNEEVMNNIKEVLERITLALAPLPN